MNIEKEHIANVAGSTVRRASPARFPPDIPVATGRLHLNEPAFLPSPKVLQAICENATAVSRYPDAQWTHLRAALAKKLATRPEQIFVGNGSDELLSLTGKAFLEQDCSIVYPTPSFPRYRFMGEYAGAKAVSIAVRPNGSCDVDAMLAACGPQTRMLVITTPNNPTGGMLSAQELSEIAREVPADTMLLVDEAYFEFAQHANGADALAAMQDRQGHWIVLRTFSKAYALAGLRVGYGIASSPQVLEAINRVRTTFNVNALAQIAALAALDDEQHMLTQVSACAAARDDLIQQLKLIGLTCLPSVANFIAIDVGCDASTFIAGLAKQEVFVGLVGPSHPTHIRVTIGSIDDNERFLNAVKKQLETTASS